MRVISLVPSLTETLIEFGVNVVGRTRFCVHPAEQVASIPNVGGTKGVDWGRCESLKPDLVIFDREENLKEMAAQCPYDWVATDIHAVEDMPREITKLADALHSEPLMQHALDWQTLLARPKAKATHWRDVPGFLKPLLEPNHHYSRIEYVIWRDPWMAVSGDTFIGSMLARLGFGEYLPAHESRYPQLAEGEMHRDDTLYLFSSEPYRFLRYHERLIEEGFKGAIVDGELYSWFGIRSYRALDSYLSTH